MWRWVRRLCVFVVLGTVTTLLVMWTASLWYWIADTRVYNEVRLPGNSSRWFTQHTPGAWTISSVPVTPSELPAHGPPIHTPLSWISTIAESKEQTPNWRVMTAGWPLDCAYIELDAIPQWGLLDGGQVWWTGGGPRSGSHLGQLGEMVGASLNDGVIPLPNRPLWKGLTANVSVYAAAWGVLWLTSTMIVRAKRRGREACLSCGYDRSDLSVRTPCPECGHWRRHKRGILSKRWGQTRSS